jgi:O-antigen/teichoic acid export membrane protein
MEAQPTPNPAKQAGALVFGTALATISSALLPLFLVRLLGKADVAELMALVLVYETFALILTGGFPQTLSYHLPGRPVQERRAIAIRVGLVMVGLGAVAALLTALIGVSDRNLPGIFSVSGESGISFGPLLVLAPSLLFELPSRLVPNLLVAEQRAREASMLGVVRTILITLATLVPVALGQSILAVAGWYSACRAVLGLSLPWAIGHCFPRVARGSCPVSIPQLFRFALPLGATDVVSLLNQQFDRYLILLSFPAVAFAEYQAGAWQVPVISTIAYSVGAAYMPALVQAFGRGAAAEAIAIWKGTIVKVSLIVLPVTMGFMVAAADLMELLFTKDYVTAAPVFQLYSVLTLGRVAAFGSVIVAAGKPRFVLQAALLSLVSNVAFAIPLTRSIGFLGPALANALAFFPMVAFYVWSIARASNVSIGTVFPLAAYGRVLLLTCIAGAVAYWLRRFLPEQAALRLTIAVGTTVLVFVVLGSLTRTIERGDWRYARDWLRLKFAR